ncbi:MAG: nucleoside triphosphate pyrophosphohydrolase [Deltaproteobacteria bacterium]|nr:nucleoside triphosphate pyrophosphohydrolase [Deltaproteobacteria bacterium]
MNKKPLSEAIIALQDLVASLRGPEGCPWDLKQNEDTIKMYLMEEAYEVLDAIEEGTPDDVCQELGDLLFQILFLARLAEERGEFDLADVLEKITQKMIHRHPHVFGPAKVKGADEVSANWERIKREEKGGQESLSTRLEGVPGNLPALLRAHRLQERASKGGVDESGPEEVWARVTGNIQEIRGCSPDKGDAPPAENLGELLFDLVKVARAWGLNAEHLLRGANNDFIEGLKEKEKKT